MKHTLLKVGEGFDTEIFFIRLSVQDLIDLERFLGKNPLNIINDYPLTKDIAMTLYFSLLHNHNDITLGDAYDLVDDIGKFETAKVIVKLFFDMGIYSKEEKVKQQKSQNSPASKPKKKTKPETVEEQIVDLYESFVESGLDTKGFWDKSMGEINNEINSHKAKCREKANFDYIQSALIAANIGEMFSTKKGNKLTIDKVYPTLFDNNSPKPNSKQVDPKTAQAQANLMKWVQAFKAKEQYDKVQKEIKEMNKNTEE